MRTITQPTLALAVPIRTQMPGVIRYKKAGMYCKPGSKGGRKGYVIED